MHEIVHPNSINRGQEYPETILKLMSLKIKEKQILNSFFCRTKLSISTSKRWMYRTKIIDCLNK
jgi:hypothetical protein